MYFEIKIKVVKENGSKVSEIFVTDAVSFTDVEVIANKYLEGITFEIEAITRKNYINIFQSPKGGFYYKVSIEWEDLESKTIKEVFLQQALDIDEGKALLLVNLKGNVEVKAIVETKVLDFI